MANSTDKLKQIIVLGAGVIGLTTAVKIQERGGYRVTIVAEILPGDPRSTKYTSQWAGAHYVSLAGNDSRQQKIDRESFDVMWDLSAPGGLAEGCFLRITHEEYYGKKISLDPLAVMPDFRELPEDSLVPAGAVQGVSFKTVTIDPPIYLDYLMSRFLAKGGSVVRGSVQHIDQLTEGGAYPFSGRGSPTPPDAIVVCTGLGARVLGGVEDKDVYSIRGQTVLLRAPWIRFGRTFSSNSGSWTYIIPRKSGDVIVGGTKGIDDWYPIPEPETTRDILQNALALCPELVPSERRSDGESTVEDLLPIVIEDRCGLRPGRKGGIRLEVERARSGSAKGKVPIVYNYGHASHGFISSWGSASVALNLMEGSLME